MDKRLQEAKRLLNEWQDKDTRKGFILITGNLDDREDSSNELAGSDRLLSSVLATLFSDEKLRPLVLKAASLVLMSDKVKQKQQEGGTD